MMQGAMAVMGLAAIGLAAIGPVASVLVLAVIQGLTEFLPVSSSGHLALGQILMDIGEGSLAEDIALHLGTLLAVVVFYRRDIVELARGFFARGPWLSESRRYVSYLVVANVPIGLVGILFEDRVKAAFDDVNWILGALAVTGVMLFVTRFVRRGDRDVNVKTAMVIGLAQAVAILPGCSRSGWTIAAALALGIAPAKAARFSFLLSVPAILGAAVLESADVTASESSPALLGLGALVAGMVGLACLSWLVRLVRNMELHRFGYYLWALAVVGWIWLG